MMRRRYDFKILETTIRFNFLNFNDMPPLFDLTVAGGDTRPDLDIYFFKDKQGLGIKRISRGRMAGSAKKFQGKPYCEIFNFRKKRFFCLFEDAISLEAVMNYAVFRSFFVFQSILDMLFLHSASIIMGDKVYLFVAPSGGGKSTISSFAEEKDLRVLSEEYCVIKRRNNRFFAALFPSGLPSLHSREKWEIGGVFLLNKADANRASGISIIEAIRRTMPEATSFFHDLVPQAEKANYRRNAFSFLDSMFQSVDIRLLDFRRDPSIFSYLRGML